MLQRNSATLFVWKKVRNASALTPHDMPIMNNASYILAKKRLKLLRTPLVEFEWSKNLSEGGVKTDSSQK